MSVKRQATTELNHENWDQEEPADQNEKGTFRTASRDILEKRVIRTAKRRNPISISDEPKKSVFMNTKLGNSNKPSSFDFLANLTNHNKNTNGSTSGASVAPSLFGSKPMSFSGGLFGKSTTDAADSTSLASTSGSKPIGLSGGIFGNSSLKASNSTSIPTSTKSESNSQSAGQFDNSTTNITNSTFANPLTSTSLSSKPIGQSGELFGNSATKASDSIFAKPLTSTSPVGSAVKTSQSSLFAVRNTETTINKSPSKTESSMSTTMVQTTLISTYSISPFTPEKKEDKPNEKKIKYYAKLKGLNESVSDWINKHVAQSPICILTPIFKDYDRYLKEITDEYYAPEKDDTRKNTDSTPETKAIDPETKTSTHSASSATAKPSLAGPQFNTPYRKLSTENKQSPFAIKTPKHPAFDTTTTNTSFAFGVTSPVVSSPSSSTKPVIGSQSSPGLIPTGNKSPSITFGVKTSSTSNATSSATSTSFAFGATSPAATSSPSSFTKTVIGNQNNLVALPSDNKPSTFSFGIKSPTTNNVTNTTTSSTGFAFGVTSVTSSTPSTSSFTKTDIGAQNNTFSFGNKTHAVMNATNSPKTGTGIAFGMTTPIASASSSPISLTNNSSTKPVIGQSSSAASPDNKSSPFSFGIKISSANVTATPTSSTGFAFGVTSSISSSSSSPFALPTNSSTNQNSAPFSFGIGKPFSFSAANVQQSSVKSANEETKDDEDEPPKVEFTPVKEDNSVYENKCKIYVKKEGNFVDKGVGTLYVKKIEESAKHQLLVRANTNLGTILLNLILSSSIPMQRAGKNNVMLVCIPTPDAQPPPTPVLIKVKTTEKADELLETLKKYTA